MTIPLSLISVDNLLLASLGALIGAVLSGVLASLLQSTSELRHRDDELREAVVHAEMNRLLLKELEEDEHRLALQRERSVRAVLTLIAYTGLIVLAGLVAGILTSSLGVVAATAGLLTALSIMLLLFYIGRAQGATAIKPPFEDLRLPLEEPEISQEFEEFKSPENLDSLTIERSAESLVQRWLEQEGWRVKRGPIGIDLVATREKERLLVEVKSTRPREVEINAFIGAVARSRLLSQEVNTRYALVLPESQATLKDEARQDLQQLGVEIYELSDSGKVRQVA